MAKWKQAAESPNAPEPQNEGEVTAYVEQADNYSYCEMPVVPERELAPEVNPDRAALIRVLEKKWSNGTVLHYYFFDQESDGTNVSRPDGTIERRTWTTNDAEKEVVRQAFKIWKEVGIGLEFEEVDSRDEAEIRIGFMRGNGAWSYVGRDIIDMPISRDERTMNFGWDLTRDAREIDTAVHEIGHTLGFPHEHQNPNAGLVWDEPAVYAALAQPPNRWSQEKTFWNIIRKLNPTEVEGSNWDPDSIMHYPFSPGLIRQPERYFAEGLRPRGGLSQTDMARVSTFYPPLREEDYTELKQFESVRLGITAGQQRNFVFRPDATRYYDMRTFGVADTNLVLFENVGGNLRYLSGEDDSGQPGNAAIRVKLRKEREYVLRVRVYYADRADETSLMVW